MTLAAAPAFGDARLPTRFWAKVRMLPNGCWEWTGGHTLNGYGRFWVGSRRDGTSRLVLAHRWAYEHLVGPFPAGLQSDHLCRNRACVTPAHIEPVTSRENTLRGNGLTAQHARRTHCLRGHPYDDANTYHRPDSQGRTCRACNRRPPAYWRAYRVQKASA